MFKKGFTLLEVVLSLIFISMIATYSIREYQKSLFNKAIIELSDTVYFMISQGIFVGDDGIAGYSSGIDGNCSSNVGQFEGLDTNSLYACMEWNNRFDIDPNGIGTISNGGLMEEYGGCLFQTEVVAGDDTSFDVFIDCSNVNVDMDARALSRIEEVLDGILGAYNRKDLIAETITRNATGIIANGGTDDDGMIRARFSN
jgi:hypothetical protein